MVAIHIDHNNTPSLEADGQTIIEMSPPIAIIGGGQVVSLLLGFLNATTLTTSFMNETPLPPMNSRALKAAGLFDEFKKYARWDATTTLVLDKNGTTHLVFGQDRDAPEIDRAALRKLLLDSIPPHKIIWGHSVSTVERDENGELVIAFADGSSVSGFRLVIGADGAWSKVRHLLTPASPRYSGKHYIEGRITTQNPFHRLLSDKIGRGSLISMGDGKQISAQRQGDGSYRIYLGLSVAENFTTNGDIDLVTDTGEAARSLLVSEDGFFADWAPELKGFVTNSEGPLRAWPLYHMPSEALCWERSPGVALVGDAAHVSTPFVGEGVNCSMYDSLVLVGKIAEYGLDKLDEATVEYERDMFLRGKDLIDRSNGSAVLLFAQDAPKPLLEVIARSKG
ncbi:Monooxygenase asqM-like protein [Cladobotryum mycophilum]|uniref:Monooxygenase asqM-like protein n=1 Tax=Cladobotryum mycophilum TaxID=491253 RepID=A0ABR0T4D9_9HYPO